MSASLVSPLCPQKLRRRSSPSIQQDIAIGLGPLNRLNAGYAGHPLDLLGYPDSDPKNSSVTPRAGVVAPSSCVTPPSSSLLRPDSGVDADGAPEA